MALLPYNVDYTDKDFDSLRARLFQLISSVFPTWTDQNVSDFGNILVELFAFTGDVLTFYQDNQARESRIVTARLRKSLIGLAKLIGYTPRGASAASCDVTLTLAAPVQGGATLTIAKGDRVKTAEVTAPIFYQFLTDVVFAAGESTKTVTVENSQFAQTTVASSGFSNQSFVLPSTPYLDGSAIPVFANGTYTEVDNFLASTSTDLHFVVAVDQNARAALRFGNSVNGAIPIGSGVIDYKIGGGKAGRVEERALVSTDKTYKDSLGAAVKITALNPAASSGGDDQETNAQIAINAPQSLRVLKRAVSREDYEIAALKVPGVARALHVTNNEYAGVLENTGMLFIVPVGGGTASGGLLANVAAQFSNTGPYPKTNTFNLIVQSAAYHTINVAGTIYMRQGFTGAQTKANVLAALQSFFAIQLADGSPNTAINFGYYFQDQDGNPTGTIDWSTIFDVVRDASGVRKVDAGASGFLLNGARADVNITAIEFPILGTLSLIDGATGLPL
jgi:hypothetical protein